jgi:hypothetical protein
LGFGGEVAADQALEFGADALDGVLAGVGQPEGETDVPGAHAVALSRLDVEDVLVGGW